MALHSAISCYILYMFGFLLSVHNARTADTDRDTQEGCAVMKIIKRSGQEVTFDSEKIYAAIAKANEATTGARELIPSQIRAICEHIESDAAHMSRALAVEEIQEMVETEIMKAGAYETAKRYIRYRDRKSVV